MAIPFDTLESSKKLQAVGCDQTMADEFARQINRYVAGNVSPEDDFVTKRDLDLAMEKLRKDLTNEIKKIQVELIAALRSR